ncbi:MAG: hypothetical protein P9L96_01055, partial [Candidatus Gygaella obscura]|nr:hypothetical protein [Candidatus Gygaella obscura]
SRTGTSSTISVYPYSFTVTAEEDSYKVSEDFDLTITAKNSSSTTTPNYSGDSTLTEDGVDGELSDTAILASEFSSGVVSVSMNYNKYGTISITATDDDSAFSGTSDEISFIPESFSVTVETPPADRTKFYIKEPFQVIVSALDYDSQVIDNYTGSITITATNSRYLIGLDSSYTFVATDEGSHNFTEVKSLLDASFTINVVDSSDNTITGSDAIDTMYGKLVAVSKAGTVGDITTEIKMVDRDGNIITQDNSTNLKICLTEEIVDSTATCDTEHDYTTLLQGKTVIKVKDMMAEKVTVTPLPEMDIFDVEEGVLTFGAIQPGGTTIYQWREVR